jgi:kinesin family member 20
MGEANKINSSLMVLGQCMRILRSNQKKLSKTTRGDRAIRTEIPPYRLSRLTEMFQEFFEGHGRAVSSVPSELSRYVCHSQIIE